LDGSGTNEGVASVGSVIISATDEKRLKCYLLVPYSPRILKNDILTLRGAPKVKCGIVEWATSLTVLTTTVVGEPVG
jgi:hypothetical protein